MSRENVETLRAAFGNGPRPSTELLALMDENVAFHEPGGTGYPQAGSVLRGPRSIEEWFRYWFATWEDYGATVVECIDAGDDVFVEHLQRGRAKASGQYRHWSVYTFSAGKIVCWRHFRARGEALKAVGLSE